MSNQSRTSSAGYGLYRAGWAMTGLAIAFLLMDASMKLLALPVVLQAQAELGFEGEGMARGSGRSCSRARSCMPRRRLPCWAPSCSRATWAVRSL
jgi:hypothetical protein